MHQREYEVMEAFIVGAVIGTVLYLLWAIQDQLNQIKDILSDDK
jgi:hypothetical protein